MDIYHIATVSSMGFRNHAARAKKSDFLSVSFSLDAQPPVNDGGDGGADFEGLFPSWLRRESGVAAEL
jgi:hypothetical protein